MARKLSTDLSLVAVTVALLGLGLVMVWSASYALAQEHQGNAYHFLDQAGALDDPRPHGHGGRAAHGLPQAPAPRAWSTAWPGVTPPCS